VNTMKKTLTLFGALLGCLLIGAPPSAHADVNGYMTCLQNQLGSRVDSSFVSLGRSVERDLSSGVSPAAEVQALERLGLAPAAATAIVQCVIAYNP
jgi:hypothetical protein